MANRAKVKDGQTKMAREDKVSCPIPFKNYNSKIQLFSSRCRMRNIKPSMAQISKYHILEKGNASHEICDKILRTCIGFESKYDRNLNFDNIVPILSPILKSFQNKHIKYNYLEKLKSLIIRNKNKYENQKYKNQIHVHLMQIFLKTLLHEVIPLELFGTAQNLKVLKTTINKLLKSVPKKISIKKAFKRKLNEKPCDATSASIEVQSLFKKLDICNIKWLQSIAVSNSERWIIILKLLHWFFAQYIIKILHKYVVLIALKKQWVYITKDDWCNMQKEFIREKESTNALVPWTPTDLDESKKNMPIGIYKFIPSSSGLRALFLVKYIIQEKYDGIDVTLRLLQQLYVTYVIKKEMPTVRSCQKAVDKFKESTKNRLYYVRCDIQDAFGSIIQEKLYHIIGIYWKELPLYLLLRTYTLLRPRKSYKKKNNKNIANKTQTVQFLILKKSLTKITQNDKKPLHVKKTKLLAKIKKLIFEQKVKVNNRIYSIKVGVPQGTPVSPILSDIYYQHMINEIFPVYTSNGFLCTYVDDMLYITENKQYAQEFLELIRNGIPEYNVKFNPNKIETNVGLPYTPTKIKFLGCDIHF